MKTRQEELTSAAGQAYRDAAEAIEATDNYTAEYKVKVGDDYRIAAQYDDQARNARDQYEAEASLEDNRHHNRLANFYQAARDYHAQAAYWWNFMAQGFHDEDGEERAEKEAKRCRKAGRHAHQDASKEIHQHIAKKEERTETQDDNATQADELEAQARKQEAQADNTGRSPLERDISRNNARNLRREATQKRTEQQSS